MYRVQFEDFRCFGKAAPVEVRPITLLIGENSAGKTSFLAGLRVALESFTPGSVNPFNRDPYFLGGFEQIAHIGIRRGVSAKRFHISVQSAEPSADDRPGRLPPTMAEHKFTFTKGGAQPQLEEYEYAVGGTSLRLSLISETAKVHLSRNGTEISYSPRIGHLPSSDMLRHDISMLPFLLRDVAMRGRGILSDDAGTSFNEQGHQRLLDDLGHSIRRSYRMFSQGVFSSAPVRSQPLRTYTPSEVAASSEGAHVPLALSRAKADHPESWAKIREGLIGFGQRSGLFKDIDVKAFGKGDADPFQIMVKIAGTSMNLADVGYGVSQVLPILYQIQNTSRYHTFLLQQPEVHLHPRAQAELGSLFVSTVAGSTRRKPVFVIETHSDYLIDRVRIEVANGKISHDDVTIVFFQRENYESTATNLYLNDRGEIQNPPANYREFFLAEHSKLLGF